MISSNNKWLIHTLLIGLIPILTRLLVWIATNAKTVAALAAADFVTLGLVIQASIILEIGHATTLSPESKAILHSLCLAFVAMFGALYVLAALSENHVELIAPSVVLTSAIMCCLGSTVFGTALFQHFSRRSYP